MLRICPNFEQKSEILYKLGLIYKKTKAHDNAISFLNRSIEEGDAVPKLRKIEVLTNIGACFELKGEMS